MVNSDIYEKTFLCKLFHNKEVRDMYISLTLPQLFANPQRKLVLYTMQKLYLSHTEITLDNIIMYQKTKDIKEFKRKSKIESDLNSTVLFDELHDFSLDSTLALAKEIFEELHTIAFARFTEQMNKDISFDLGYKDTQAVLARAKAIVKVHKIIYANRYKQNRDQIGNAADSINKGDAIVPTWSRKLNTLMGGWSKKFINSFIGRSSHGKSTFMTQESTDKILRNLVDTVDVIAPEEPSEILWRRIFAQTFKIPITSMRAGTVKISDAQVNHVKKLYGQRLRVHDGIIKYKDIVDLMFSIKGSSFIWTDHINAIEYPGNGTSLQNMIGGIPGLIGFQKQYIMENPEAIIVNLSQVNEKQLFQNSGYWKFPKYSDAYGSQVLHQAAREFLSIYYPYKDRIQSPHEWVGKRDKASEHDMYLSIEKSSFGEVGKILFKYQPEFGIFEDVFEDSTSNVLLPDDNVFKFLGE